MGVGAGLYMYNVVVTKFTFAVSSPDEFLLERVVQHITPCLLWAPAPIYTPIASVEPRISTLLCNVHVGPKTTSLCAKAITVYFLLCIVSIWLVIGY